MLLKISLLYQDQDHGVSIIEVGFQQPQLKSRDVDEWPGKLGQLIICLMITGYIKILSEEDEDKLAGASYNGC